MKRLILLALLMAGLSGCSLIPKKVEYFQKTVQPIPEATAKQKETQKQAADFVARKSRETVDAAIASGATPAVTEPAKAARDVAGALSSDLGAPRKAWTSTSTNLVKTLHAQENALDTAIDKAREKQSTLVGKKIEGTGLIQIGYFTQIGLILGLLVLVWAGLKIWGMINPVVGLGTNLAGRVGSSIVSRGFSEIVAGGERFKNYLDTSPVKDDIKNYILDLFSRAHQEAQSQDVQKLVTTITSKDPATVTSTAAPPPTT